MRPLGVAAVTAAILTIASLTPSGADACKIVGPIPTPPVPDATLGTDCNWHAPDGKTYASMDGMEELLSLNFTYVEDGDYWWPKGVPLQAEPGHNEDLPLAIIIPAAILLPLAVLVVFSLIKPKGGGH